MPTAFVTGATGFVGLNLVSRLVEQGWQVIALHRPSSRLTFLERFDVARVQGAVEDLDSLMAAIPQGVDVVFHAAAKVSWWRGNDAEQHRTNVDGTRNVARAALSRKAGRLIYTSSIAVYGEQGGTIDEQRPSTALESPAGYLRTKYLAEQELRAVMADGLDAVLLNPANIIGPYDVHNWGRTFRMAARGRLPGAPPGASSFCHVRPVVDAHLAAVDKGRRGENYILAGVDATYLELTQIVFRLVGKPRVPTKPLPAWLLKTVGWLSHGGAYITRKEPDLPPDLVRVLCKRVAYSSDKAVRELGYDADQSLETMLADCHAWLVAEGLLPPR